MIDSHPRPRGRWGRREGSSWGQRADERLRGDEAGSSIEELDVVGVCGNRGRADCERRLDVHGCTSVVMAVTMGIDMAGASAYRKAHQTCCANPPAMMVTLFFGS